MSVSKKSMWGADTGNKTAAVPVGRNLLSDRDVLEAAGGLSGTVDRSAAGSGCHFFLMQKEQAGKSAL